MFDFDDEDNNLLDDFARAIGERVPPFYFFLFVALIFGVLAYISWQAMVFASFVGFVVWLITF